ncbi:MAG: flagellar basal body rod protein FlgB [Oscillospiraceae bacterium]|jgi:flagellar basal-body rod protein FlgB|nr:flagellar basal body rod protein FlgB [Oscillospiraceae bacterium]
MWDRIFKPADLLQKGLSASWTRNAVIRNNIANVETPGFKASDVVFEELLAQALEGSGFKGAKTHERHIDIGPYKQFKGVKTHEGHIDIGDSPSVDALIVERGDTSMRMDGNNVDIEAENVRLARNSIYYNTLMEKLNSELRRIKLAVTEGK